MNEIDLEAKKRCNLKHRRFWQTKVLFVEQQIKILKNDIKRIEKVLMEVRTNGEL